MATFGETVSNIRTDLNRGTAHDTRIKKAIVDAIKFYRAHRFGWNLKRAETVIEQGDEFVAIPTDWIEVDHMRLEKDGVRDPLVEVSYDWIEERQRNAQQGRPCNYAIENREIRIYPIADTSYSLMMSFQFELKDVSVSASDGAENAWLTEGEELIRKHAVADLYVNYFRGETIPEGQALAAYVENELVPNLENQAAREQSVGKTKAYL